MTDNVESTKFISEPVIVFAQSHPLTGSYNSRTLVMACKWDFENSEKLYQAGVQFIDLDELTKNLTKKIDENGNIAYDEDQIHRGRFLILKDKFERELKRKGFDSSDEIKDVFNIVALQLCKINFKNTDVEITPNNAIKFIFKFSGNKMLMVSKRVKESDEKSDSIVFSYFVNSELILSDATNVSEFTDGIKQYLTV